MPPTRPAKERRMNRITTLAAACAATVSRSAVAGGAMNKN
jgi:hypothetical protein